MRRLLIATAVAAALVPAGQATGADKHSCGPRKAHTEARSAWMRVYSKYRLDGDDELSEYYACLLRGGKPLQLDTLLLNNESGSAASSGYITKFALAGRYVAFSSGDCSLFGCQFTFRVVDVRRRLVTRYVNQPQAYAGMVVATFSGRVAVLAGADGASRSDRRTGYVLKLDSDGAVELDRGLEVRDLTLAGRTLHWFNGPDLRSAQLH